jgi:predicted Zn finger-like uncharacterized protein
LWNEYAVDAMLIVCPSCATSYMIDPAALAPAGRTVRCARCKVTWFAAGPPPAPELTEFVDDVFAEAETQTAGGGLAAPTQPATDATPAPAAEDDTESVVPIGQVEPEPVVTREVELPPSPAPAEAIVDAPSLVPPAEHEPLPEAFNNEADSEDVESYAARRRRLQARRKERRRSSRWTAIVVLLFAVNVAVIGGRDVVVRVLPQTASFFAAIGLPVNLRHLSFENVKISKEAQDGVNVLIVQGTIVSTTSKPITVPRLRFAARDVAGQEIYVWTALPSRSILGPGEHLEFRSRLASPPAGARNVMVRFFNSQDTAAGAE